MTSKIQKMRTTVPTRIMLKVMTRQKSSLFQINPQKPERNQARAKRRTRRVRGKQRRKRSLIYPLLCLRRKPRGLQKGNVAI
jgi:hypothetical protein